MEQNVTWIYDDRLVVGLRLLVVKIHVLGKQWGCNVLRIILMSCTNILAICTENYTDILHEVSTFCIKNYSDIVHNHCGCLHWELYWYPAWVLWLFALRIILISWTKFRLFALRIIVISCTTIVAVCTENYTDILHEHCACLHWELYWYPEW